MERRWRPWARLQEEQGAELLEFIGIFPLILLLMMVVWQFALVGYTGIVAANAAREGARALAVAESCESAVNLASHSWNSSTRRVRCRGGSGLVHATVELQIPKALLPLTGWLPGYPWISVTSTMRYEPPYHSTW